jgi:hypothetical protein
MASASAHTIAFLSKLPAEYLRGLKIQAEGKETFLSRPCSGWVAAFSFDDLFRMGRETNQLIPESRTKRMVCFTTLGHAEWVAGSDESCTLMTRGSKKPR